MMNKKQLLTLTLRQHLPLAVRDIMGPGVVNLYGSHESHATQFGAYRQGTAALSRLKANFWKPRRSTNNSFEAMIH